MAELGLDTGARLLGPLTEHRVVVGGREIPYLTAYEKDGGEVELVFDHRLAVSIPAGRFEDLAWFVASVIQQCLDPALGRHFPEVMELVTA